MNILIRDYLSDYLEFDAENNVYRTINKTDLRPNTKGRILRLMDEWAYATQSELDDFS